jgi:hypothetical protein
MDDASKALRGRERTDLSVQGLWRAQGETSSGRIQYYLQLHQVQTTDIVQQVFGSHFGEEQPFTIKGQIRLRDAGEPAQVEFTQRSPEGWQTSWVATVLPPTEEQAEESGSMVGTWSGHAEGVFTAMRVLNAGSEAAGEQQSPLSKREKRAMRRVFRGSVRVQADKRAHASSAAHEHLATSGHTTPGCEFASGDTKTVRLHNHGQTDEPDGDLAGHAAAGGLPVVATPAADSFEIVNYYMHRREQTSTGGCGTAVCTLSPPCGVDSNLVRYYDLRETYGEIPGELTSALSPRGRAGYWVSLAAATRSLRTAASAALVATRQRAGSGVRTVQQRTAVQRAAMEALLADEFSKLEPIAGINIYPKPSPPHFLVFAALRARALEREGRLGGLSGAGSGGGASGSDSGSSCADEDDSDSIAMDAAAQLMDELAAAGVLTPYTVLEMAEYLGIDAQKEWMLLWIAQACALEPLPEGWTEQVLPEDGRVVYVCNEAAVGGQVQVHAEHPMDQTYRELLASERISPTRAAQPYMCFYLPSRSSGGEAGGEEADSFWVDWEKGCLSMQPPPAADYFDTG